MIAQANLRAKKTRESKKEESGIQSVVKSESGIQSTVKSEAGSDVPKFFDPRVNMKGAVRTGRRFQFNDPGKFVKIGTQLRMKVRTVHCEVP
jgi:hypothetical protein